MVAGTSSVGPSGAGISQAAIGIPMPGPASSSSGGASKTAAAAGGTSGGGNEKTTTSGKGITSKKSSSTKLGKDGKPLKKKVRKKKPPSNRPSSVNHIAVTNAANSAKAELAQLKAIEIARRSDPLWFEAKEVCYSAIAAAAATSAVSGSTGADAMVSSSASTGVSVSAAVLPNQVDIVEAALRNNNLTRVDVTPQAFACLLEQTRRHALDLLADAQDYAYAANRHDVSTSDLLLAADLRADGGDFLTDVATQQPKISAILHETNKKPLPTIPTTVYDGIALPPKHHQLTARTFDIVSGARISKKMITNPPSFASGKHPVSSSTTVPGATGSSSASPEKPKKLKRKSSGSIPVGYGAKRGAQIPIQLKSGSSGASAAKAAADAKNGGATAATPMVGVTPTPGSATSTSPNKPTSIAATQALTSSSPSKSQQTNVLNTPVGPPAP